MAKRTNCPSSTKTRGKVNADVRSYAGFQNVGGVGASGADPTTKKPSFGTGGKFASNAKGDSKGSQQGK